MRKLRREGKGKKITCAIAVAAMVMSSMTACGSTSEDAMQESNAVVETVVNTTSAEESKATEAAGAENKVAEGSYMGSITAIDGNTITVAVMGGGMAQGEKPSGEAPEGMLQGEMPSGEAPEDMLEGMNPADMATETKTVEVSDTTVITVKGETATVSDLQVGDNVMVEMDGETVVSITVVVMEAPQGQPAN